MYITQSNLSRIVSTIKFDYEFEQKANQFYKEISFLTKKEKAGLLAFRLITESNEVVSKDLLVPFEGYSKDEYLNTTPGSKPAYHKDSDCERLNQDFIGIKAPDSLKDKQKEINAWAKENEYLLKRGDKDLIDLRFRAKFGKGLIHVRHENSGHSEFKYNTLDEIVIGLKKLIDLGNGYGDNATEKKIVKAFSSIHFITGKPNFKSEYYDKELVNTTMKRFNKEVRYPLINLLRTYYIMRFNSRLEFGSSILSQLGFVPCRCCQTNVESIFRIKRNDQSNAA